MTKNVKNTTIISVLDLLAPHSCRGCGHIGDALCPCCKNYIFTKHANICPHCKALNPTGKCPKCHDLPPTYIGGTRDGLLGTLVHDFKYHSVRTLARPLAEIIDHALPNIEGEVAIVPLPTIQRHIRERGLDHTYLIAKRLAKIHGPHYHTTRLLTRAKNTVQVGTDRTQRLTQASHAYTIADSTTIDPSTTYILLDDVWTTGASLRAATEKLRQAGAKHIILAILAVSQLD